MKILLLYHGSPNTYHFSDRELSRLGTGAIYACGCQGCLAERGKALRMEGLKVRLVELDVKATPVQPPLPAPYRRFK